MFASIANGYPIGPAPGGTEDLLGARVELVAGRLQPDVFRRELDGWVTRMVDEQVASGLAMVCDGDGRWIDGQPGLARDLLAGRLTSSDVVAAWRHADTGTNVLTKQVLPGPWTASLSLTHGAADRTALARDLIGVLVETGSELVAAGCPMLQFDEPAATWAGEDPDARVDEACGADLVEAIEALVDGLPAGTSICLGLPDGAPREDLREPLAELPVQSYLVDVTSGADAWRFIARVPPEKGVVVGAIDARTPAIEDPEMLVWAATLAAEMDGRGVARVGLSASGSLAGIDRHRARRKMEQAGMAVRLGSMGPLGQVARALQPEPATCRITGLPELIAHWQAAMVVGA